MSRRDFRSERRKVLDQMFNSGEFDTPEKLWSHVKTWVTHEANMSRLPTRELTVQLAAWQRDFDKAAQAAATVRR